MKRIVACTPWSSVGRLGLQCTLRSEAEAGKWTGDCPSSKCFLDNRADRLASSVEPTKSELVADSNVVRCEQMARTLIARFEKTVLSVCLVAVPSVAAYVYPFSEESIREAYFFGSGSAREKVGEFLGQYLRRFPLADTGPSVREVEFRTPYERVVRRSSENSVGYSAQQAQKDYAAEPDLVVVRLFLTLGPTAAGLVVPPTYHEGRVADPRENFWRDFRFRVAQESSFEPKNVRGRPLYSRRGRGLGGAEVLLEFNAAKFAAAMTHVEVTTPEGQTIRAEFDLGKLK